MSLSSREVGEDYSLSTVENLNTVSIYTFPPQSFRTARIEFLFLISVLVISVNDAIFSDKKAITFVSMINVSKLDEWMNVCIHAHNIYLIECPGFGAVV